MILAFLGLIFTFISILGYSFTFKRFFFNKKQYGYIQNLDIFYGVALLIFLSLFINFFSSINNFGLPIVVIGLFLFIYSLKIRIVYFYNYKIISIIFLFFIFISAENGLNYDSSLYHLQTIKWIYNYKISFGLANIENRLGLNSSWHYFLSIFNFGKLDLIYCINIIIYTIFLNELLIIKKKSQISFYFLFFSFFFISLFSLFHPMKNGIILNNLGSPEVDTIIMLIFLINIYLFLKLKESHDDNYFYLISTTTIIAFTIKISSFVLILLPLFVFIKKINYKKYINYYIFNFVLVLIWLISNFIKSGCFIFPIHQTCANVHWSISSDSAKHFSNIVQSFARDTRLREKFSDFNHTLDTYNWFVPWFNDYYLNTALLKIVTIIFIFSTIFLIVSSFIYKNKNFKFSINNYFYIFFFFILSFFIWFKAPEVRFGYGFLIGISCFLFSICFLKMKFIHQYIYHRQLILIICLLLIIKNIAYFKSFNQFLDRNFYYKDFEIVKIVDKYKIYYPGDNKFCNSFIDICIYQKNFLYSVKDNYSYTFIYK
jgi:hypothetical protein